MYEPLGDDFDPDKVIRPSYLEGDHGKFVGLMLDKFALFKDNPNKMQSLYYRVLERVVTSKYPSVTRQMIKDLVREEGQDFFSRVSGQPTEDSSPEEQAAKLEKLEKAIDAAANFIYLILSEDRWHRLPFAAEIKSTPKDRLPPHLAATLKEIDDLIWGGLAGGASNEK